MVTSVAGHDVTSLLAITDQPAPETDALPLTGGYLASAPSEGADVLTSATDLQAVLAHMYGATGLQAPKMDVDFERRAVLVLAFNTSFGPGAPVVTSIGASIQVTYPELGSYGLSGADDQRARILTLFEIPNVPATTPIEVARPQGVEVAKPIAWQP